MATTHKLISSVTVGAGGAANIEFTSIPQTYTDLIIYLSSRTDVSNVDTLSVIVNNDSAGLNANKFLDGSGSSARSGSSNGYQLLRQPSNYTANTFSNQQIYIPNYTNSSYKSFAGEGVTENNATESYLTFTASLWTNTAAITTIKLLHASGNFVQYSTAYLYGIKNS